MDDEEAASIKISKDLLYDLTIRAVLLFISSSYGFLEVAFKKLESYGQPLYLQIKVVTDSVEAIFNINGKAADSIEGKLSNIIEKSNCFDTLKNISEELSGVSIKNMAKQKHTIAAIIAFKYGLITSADVRRSFSMYKIFFRANSQSFLFKNLSECL